jgi:putative sensor protein
MTVEQAAGTPGGGGIWRVLAAPLQLRTWTATIYLLASMFVGVAWFVILSVGLTLGVGLLIVWVGVLVLALTLLAWRGGAWLERRWVRAMLGVRIPEPYRPLPAGSLWQRARVLAGDPATWKDLAYLVLLLPLGMVWFVVTTTLWTFALGLLTAPLWYWTPSEGGLALLVNGERSYLVIDTLPTAPSPWPCSAPATTSCGPGSRPSRPAATGPWTRPRPSAAGSSATCTTAPSSGW